MIFFYHVLIFLIKVILIVIDIIDSLLFLIAYRFKPDLGQSVLIKQTITEEDSAWQVKQILERKNSQITAKTKAKMLKHILEEREHSDMFKKGLSDKGQKDFNKKNISRDVSGIEKNNKFFIKVGEQAAIRKYKLLLFFRILPEIHETYENILKDELEHAEELYLSSNQDLLLYLKSAATYLKFLLGQKLDIFFMTIFFCLLYPFYILVFSPVAIISKLIEGRNT